MTPRTQQFTMMACLLLAPGIALAQGVPAPPGVVLRIDPRLIAEAAEVWPLIAGRENPIWPGWDA